MPLQIKYCLPAIALAAILASSCYRSPNCRPRNEPAAPVPEATRQWFPYAQGQQFRLANNGGDTLEASVLRAGEIFVHYDATDHCPAQSGVGIAGSVLIGIDTLNYTSDIYPNYLSIDFRGVAFTLGNETLYQEFRDPYNNSADTVTLNGRLFQKTVRGILPDSAFAFYLSQGVGASGLLLGGDLYSSVQ